MFIFRTAIRIVNQPAETTSTASPLRFRMLDV
jgi:hypothetical protein